MVSFSRRTFFDIGAASGVRLLAFRAWLESGIFRYSLRLRRARVFLFRRFLLPLHFLDQTSTPFKIGRPTSCVRAFETPSTVRLFPDGWVTLAFWL